jgi:Protein of unknown function (DUF2634)
VTQAKPLDNKEMADYSETYDPLVEQTVPTDDIVIDSEDALTELEIESEESILDPFRVDLIDEETELYPYGKSYQFDFAAGRFTVIPNKGPLQTNHLMTLKAWIEKCLLTARAAYPIYSDDYGVDNPSEGIGLQYTDELIGQMETNIEEALTQHPRILSVQSFASDYDPAEEELFVSFTCVVDGEDNDIAITGLAIPLG